MKPPFYNIDTLDHILHIGNHDTFTWLSNINGLAHILLQQADNLTDEQRDWIQSIHEAATRCRRMSITKLCVITNIIADVFYEPAESIMLTDVFADVIAALNANVRYGSRPVSIAMHADSDVPPVHANRRRLEYCFHTIMSELRQTQPHDPAHLQLTGQPTAIEISIRPLDIINREHRAMLTLLLEDNGARDITWDETTVRFLLPSDQAPS